MINRRRVQLYTLLLLMFGVHVSWPVCVDVPSETEAVVGNSMKLSCIACMKREEVRATTLVDWYYLPNGKDSQPQIHIFQYKDGQKLAVEGPWQSRLIWNGSTDLQDVSIRIMNVTFNDSGTYQCLVLRQFKFDFFTPSVTKEKVIELKVKEKASEDVTAIYSEIMMYVLLVFLTFWLLIEMVYCYRKISKSDEQTQDTETNYLAIPSEQKEYPAAPVTE